MSAALDTAAQAIEESARLSNLPVLTLTAGLYIPHGIREAAQSGAIAATAMQLIWVADSAPAQIVRHELDPEHPPMIVARRLAPAAVDFGDGRLFVMPTKAGRALKNALGQPN